MGSDQVALEKVSTKSFVVRFEIDLRRTISQRKIGNPEESGAVDASLVYRRECDYPRRKK